MGEQEVANVVLLLPGLHVGEFLVQEDGLSVTLVLAGPLLRTIGWRSLEQGIAILAVVGRRIQVGCQVQHVQGLVRRLHVRSVLLPLRNLGKLFTWFQELSPKLGRLGHLGSLGRHRRSLVHLLVSLRHLLMSHGLLTHDWHLAVLVHHGRVVHRGHWHVDRHLVLVVRVHGSSHVLVSWILASPIVVPVVLALVVVVASLPGHLLPVSSHPRSILQDEAEDVDNVSSGWSLAHLNLGIVVHLLFSGLPVMVVFVLRLP